MIAYRFYIRTESGEDIEWRGLTETQAKRMYATTKRFQPHNIIRYGWEQL